MTAHFCRRLLAHLGLKPERLALHWASAAEASLYVELITAFTQKVEALGPLGSECDLTPAELAARLKTARVAVTDTKLRTRLAKLALELRESKDYAPETLSTRLADKLEPLLLKTLS